LRSLLHADFREFGASGQVHVRDSIIGALVASDGSAAEASGFRAATGAVLLTYRIDRSLRTSVTAVPGNEAAAAGTRSRSDSRRGPDDASD
jgi:hypothetical protein